MSPSFGKLICTAAVFFMASGCQSIQPPEVRYDESFDFQQAKTFAWISSSPLSFHPLEAEVDPTLEPELMYQTGRLLTQAGLQQVDDVGEADLAVAFSVGSRSRWLVERKEPMAVIRDGFEQWRQRDWLTSGIEGASYVAGQICVELYSIEQRRPIWHGTMRDLMLDPDGGFGGTDLQNILTTILGNYPPE